MIVAYSDSFTAREETIKIAPGAIMDMLLLTMEALDVDANSDCLLCGLKLYYTRCRSGSRSVSRLRTRNRIRNIGSIRWREIRNQCK